MDKLMVYRRHIMAGQTFYHSRHPGCTPAVALHTEANAMIKDEYYGGEVDFVWHVYPSNGTISWCRPTDQVYINA